MINKLITLSLIIFLFSCNTEIKQKESENRADTTNIQEITTNEDRKNIIFFGNSLTAGYGVDPSEAFTGRIQRKIDSLGLDYLAINAGVSGETTASGLSRVEWVVKRQPVEIFVLELGGNDGLRGIDPEETEKNLKAIIDKVRIIHPDVEILLAGMMIPPNMGSAYASRFQAVFPRVAEEKNVELIPFLLEDVGGVAKLNLPDGIHPTPEGHKIVSNTVWKFLRPMLQENG
ncbi:arylesterase [Marivirga aurantiaca]|nr:arylesterase [Marivirga aurantiaca]